MSNQTTLVANDMAAPKLVKLIDGFVRSVGHGTSWLSLLLIFTILLQVILRYVFSSGFVVLEELQWHIYAVLVMNAVSYGVTEDIHVRMDLLYSRRSETFKAWTDIFGLILFALPLSIILCIKGIDLVQTSFAVRESSAVPNGLPFRWLIKALLPASMILYALAATSRVIRLFVFIFKKKEE